MLAVPGLLVLPWLQPVLPLLQPAIYMVPKPQPTNCCNVPLVDMYTNSLGLALCYQPIQELAGELAYTRANTLLAPANTLLVPAPANTKPNQTLTCNRTATSQMDIASLRATSSCVADVS